MNETDRCPFCLEEIRPGARKCRHCGEFLPGTADPSDDLATAPTERRPPADTTERRPPADTTERRPPLPNDPVHPDDMPTLLADLTERSLVIRDHDTGRFRLLETVRQYARDRLLESGEPAVWRERHLACFRALAEEADASLAGPDQQIWLERLETEHDNLRAAMEFSPDHGLRVAGSLSRFWFMRGHLNEGRDWLTRALQAPCDDALDHRAARAKALMGAGNLAYFQRDTAAARALHEESLALYRELEDPRGTAIALCNLGNVAAEEGDHAAALDHYEQSLVYRRALDDLSGIAATLNNMGNLAFAARRYHEVGRLCSESVEIYRQLGDRWGMSMALANVGLVALETGDAAAARERLRESLEIRQELGDQWGTASALMNLGIVAAHLGDPAAARVCLEESLAINRELRDPRGIALCLANIGSALVSEGDFDAARSRFRESLSLYAELGEARPAALCLEGLAALAMARGEPLRAAYFWGAAERLREEGAAPMAFTERAALEKSVESARRSCEEAAFAASWAEGRRLSAVEAVSAGMMG